jgi:hypothetical protein
MKICSANVIFLFCTCGQWHCLVTVLRFKHPYPLIWLSEIFPFLIMLHVFSPQILSFEWKLWQKKWENKFLKSYHFLTTALTSNSWYLLSTVPCTHNSFLPSCWKTCFAVGYSGYFQLRWSCPWGSRYWVVLEGLNVCPSPFPWSCPPAQTNHNPFYHESLDTDS